MPTAKKTFTTVKCEHGLYVTRNDNYSPIGYNERLNEGKHEVVSTWKKGWILLKGAEGITSWEKLKSGEKVNFRWELIDKDENPLNLPEVISQEDAHEKKYDYDWYIGEECEYYKYRSLYNRVNDNLPDTWEANEFAVEHRGDLSVDDVNNFQDMKVTLHNDRVNFRDSNVCKMDLSEIVRYDSLEELLTPPLAIHNRPCSLTSHQTYKIIRAHVKENINNMYGVITSDYDFCFTVKKRIPVKPYVIKTEIKKKNGRSYAKPKFSRKDVDHKQIEIFEMTHEKRGYQNYTIIKGFEGENLQDIATQIKVYLDELMERINEPLVECEHCNGYGHIIKK
jgi:hypothetical protein